jgi:hypothetical protein
LFINPASAGGGVNTILSEVLRADIDKAVKSDCKDIDGQCFESIKSLLINRKTELESRQIEVAATALFALIALAIPWIEKDSKKGIPVAIHIPSTQFGPATSAAQASTLAIVTGQGTSITITPKPNPVMVTE